MTTISSLCRLQATEDEQDDEMHDAGMSVEGVGMHVLDAGMYELGASGA